MPDPRSCIGSLSALRPVHDLWVWRSLSISETPLFNEMQIMHQQNFRFKRLIWLHGFWHNGASFSMILGWLLIFSICLPKPTVFSHTSRDSNLLSIETRDPLKISKRRRFRSKHQKDLGGDCIKVIIDVSFNQKRKIRPPCMFYLQK